MILALKKELIRLLREEAGESYLLAGRSEGSWLDKYNYVGDLLSQAATVLEEEL